MTSLQEMPVRLLDTDEHESTSGPCQPPSFTASSSFPLAPACALAIFLSEPTNDRLAIELSQSENSLAPDLLRLQSLTSETPRSS